MKSKPIVSCLLATLLLGSILVGCKPSLNEEKLKADANKDHLSIFLSFDEDEDLYYASNVSNTEEKYLIDSLRNDVTGNIFYNESKPAHRAKGVSGDSLTFDGYTTSIDLGNPLYGKSEFTLNLWMAIRAYDFVDVTRNITPLVEYEVNPKSWTKIKLNLLMTSSVFYRTCFQFRYNSFIVVIFYIFF